MIPSFRRPRGNAARALAAVFALALLGGCTTRSVPQGSPEMAGMAPLLSVERFLQAANARDLEAMQGLFGTYDGPISGERRDLELRMSAIAEILQHSDYRIVEERQEPGREHPTTRVTVSLTRCGARATAQAPGCPPGGRVVPAVPFLVVRTGNGGWLIEEIGLESITRS